MPHASVAGSVVVLRHIVGTRDVYTINVEHVCAIYVAKIEFSILLFIQCAICIIEYGYKK